MFEEVKQQIRQEFGNEKAKKVNDEVFKKLAILADKAADEKDYKKNIAYWEIIAEDLEEYEESIGGVPIGKSGAAVTWLNVLTNCNIFGFANKPETLTLARKCRQTSDEFMGSDKVDPDVDLLLINALLSVDADANFEEAEEYGLRCLRVFQRNYLETRSDYFDSKLNKTAQALIRAYIYKGRYDDANNVYPELPDGVPDTLTYLLLAITQAYQLDNSKNYDKSDVKMWVDNISKIANNEDFAYPEAFWVLGIMYAEGYYFDKNIGKAKEFFEKGNLAVKRYECKLPYTDYNFKVLSPISQEEIISLSEKGTYHSKFYDETNGENTGSNSKIVKSNIGYGKSVEEAAEKAKEPFGTNNPNVRIEILEMPQRGLFKRKLAKVKAYIV